MPLFRYEALTVEGSRVRGVVDADNLFVAKEKLRRQQLMLQRLSALEEKSGRYSLPPQLLLSFTRELAQLLHAGLPLYESLLTIEEKYRKHKAHYLFLDLCDKLQAGFSFSSALKNHPRTFDSIYLSMVNAAEQSGSLSKVLSDLAELISRQTKLKKQITSALMYPAFLACFCFCVVLGLLLFVIPTMRELFEGRSLHPLTEIVLGLSAWMQAYGIYLLIGVLFGGTCLFLAVRRPKVKLLITELLIKIPLMRLLLMQAALIRFCRALSMLVQGGVAILPALQLSRKVVHSPLLEKALEESEAKIVEGEKLSQQLKKYAFIPPLLPRMLATAEITGSMGSMLRSAAEIYDEELERNLLQLTTFLQPLLLIILGGVVGIVLLSVLLPLTDVSSFVGT